MPADESSPIPAALAHLTHADPLQDSEPPHLLAYLASVPDPRATRGRRHPLVAILGLAAAAVLAGARSIAAIAEWAADAPQPVRAALGARRDVPGHFAVPAEATIRRTLSRLDVDALAVAVGAWLADRDRGPGPAGAGRRRAVAVDGKTLRGAHPPDGDGRPVHLLAAMDHTSRAVLAQHQVGGAPEEVPAFAPLLAPLDLADVVVTADALQTHPEAAWVPGHQQPGALPIRGQGQPAHPAGPLPAPCLAPGPRCWAAPATAATAASRSAPSRPSRSTISGSPTSPKSSRSPAPPATCATIPGGALP